MSPPWSTTTMASGAASKRPRYFASESLLSLRSRMTSEKPRRLPAGPAPEAAEPNACCAFQLGVSALVISSDFCHAYFRVAAWNERSTMSSACSSFYSYLLAGAAKSENIR